MEYARYLLDHEREHRLLQTMAVKFDNVRAWADELDRRVAEVQVNDNHSYARPGLPYYGCSGGAYTTTVSCYGRFVKGVMKNSCAVAMFGAADGMRTVWQEQPSRLSLVPKTSHKEGGGGSSSVASAVAMSMMASTAATADPVDVAATAAAAAAASSVRATSVSFAAAAAKAMARELSTRLSRDLSVSSRPSTSTPPPPERKLLCSDSDYGPLAEWRDAKLVELARASAASGASALAARLAREHEAAKGDGAAYRSCDSVPDVNPIDRGRRTVPEERLGLPKLLAGMYGGLFSVAECGTSIGTIYSMDCEDGTSIADYSNM